MANESMIQQLIAKVLNDGVATDPTINKFWRYQLEKFRDASAGGGELDQMLAALGYNEALLPSGVLNESFPKVKELIDLSKTIPRQQKSFHASLPKEKADVEHLCSLLFLQRKSLLRDYLDFANKMGLVSSMPMARHWFYHRKIKPYLDEKLKNQSNGLRVMEIGAGSGFFASLVLANAKKNMKYYIVDLPEMLINSATNISKFHSEIKLQTSSASEDGGFGSVSLLQTSEIEQIPNNSIDFIFNFNSLMEMRLGTRDYYIGQIYRVSCNDGIFYNVNRMQREMDNDGIPYSNNPCTYPYLASDEVIEMEPDEFQQDYRSRFVYGATESFAISSIQRIKKN